MRFFKSAGTAVLVVCAGHAWADLSLDGFRKLSRGNDVARAQVEAYVGGVAKGYLYANVFIGAEKQTQLFCYAGDLSTDQTLKITTQAVDDHLKKHPGDAKEEMVEMLLLMKLKQLYPC